MAAIALSSLQAFARFELDFTTTTVVYEPHDGSGNISCMLAFGSSLVSVRPLFTTTAILQYILGSLYTHHNIHITNVSVTAQLSAVPLPTNIGK